LKVSILRDKTGLEIVDECLAIDSGIAGPEKTAIEENVVRHDTGFAAKKTVKRKALATMEVSRAANSRLYPWRTGIKRQAVSETKCGARVQV
jgi:hypothetical protein